MFFKNITILNALNFFRLSGLMALSARFLNCLQFQQPHLNNKKHDTQHPPIKIPANAGIFVH